jgi:hypothetical protein
MHTATQLKSSYFSVQADGAQGGCADLLPGWGANDRFGIVVYEPFGALGASLLIQAAITSFFDARPNRRNTTAQYAEIYAFHVGGRYGDFSSFDFWPPRREVFVDDDPVAVLSAINDRAITRLAVPEGDSREVDFAGLVSAGWSERNSALERILSAFAYSATGRVERADISVTGLDPDTESNGSAALNPQATIEAFAGLTSEEYKSHWETAEFDTRGWLEAVERRQDEQPPAVRRRVANGRLALMEDGVATETYCRLDIDEALGLLVPAR